MTDTYWPELAGALFEEAGDALFLFDPESEQLRDVNPMAQRLSGFTRREMLEMKITFLIRSDIDGGLQRLRQAFRRTGLFHSQEGFWLRKKEGVWVPVNLTATRLHGEARPLGLITARDITERRTALARLQQAEQELRRVLSTVSDSLWSVELDASGQSVSAYCSPVIERLTGRPPDFFTGPATWFSIIHPEDRQHVEQNLAQLLAGCPVIQDEYRIVWPDGAVRWVRDSTVSSPADANGHRRLDGILSDVTERKLVEEALRAGQAKYRSLIENLTQSVFLKDRDLRYVAANKPFCQTVGRQCEADVVGKDDFDLYPPELAEQYRAADRLVLQEGKRLELEEKNLIGGTLRTVQKVKTPVLDDRSQVVGVLGIFWDVTDQRNLEAQLRQAHKMEAVGQLAGGIAHDFNNLLTGILGNLSLALTDLSTDHPSHELLASAEVAALRAAELTRQLLGFSRRAPLVSQPLNLNASVEETVRLLRHTVDPRIDIQVKPAHDLWRVHGDPSQIGQVLLNLCLNARDAMPDGGKLCLETANVRLDDEAPRISLDGRPGDYVRLRVSDSGVGISTEVMERIFEPFYTTKEPGRGTGLGLAMVFGIVKQHEGWIECRSTVGDGTTFDVYLPRLIVPAAAPAPLSVNDVRGGSETILLADDEAVVGRLGQTILERHGYRVLSAQDGAEAVAIYQRLGSTIDLVILDLAMPRLSGSEALGELRKINPAVPVLISSGYSREEDLRSVSEAGVLGFVAKPYRPADLARRVRAALDECRNARGKT